jgi:succinate dehydrogenase/fumarate reductase cytochrome b subunit
VIIWLVTPCSYVSGLVTFIEHAETRRLPSQSLGSRRGDRVNALALKRAFPVFHLLLVHALIGKSYFPQTTLPCSNIPSPLTLTVKTEVAGLSETLVTTYMVISLTTQCITIKIIYVCLYRAAFCHACYCISHKCLKRWVYAYHSKHYSTADHSIVFFITKSDIYNSGMQSPFGYITRSLFSHMI